MSTTIPQYPFDPTGLAETNKVIEVMAVKSKGMFDHYYVVPRVAPFYAESVKLKLYPVGSNPNNPAQGQELTEGIHYNFGYHFAHASHTIGKPVYGAISLYDRSMEGQLRMEYQTLGGDWVLDDQAMSELMLNRAYNPRIATWEQVVELPRMFPIVDHDFNIDDFVGMSDVVEVLDEIEKAILYANEGGLQNHAEDISNPHRVTKMQVGLGLVDNYPTATLGEAQQGLATNRFMTPFLTLQLINASAGANLSTHIGDKTNPHNVTKAQVGLGNVQNFTVASAAEAEAGASNARYMTPLRVREAIQAMAIDILNNHISDKTNPHQVTKEQVGLGLVPNMGIADLQVALAGLVDDGIITPRVLAYVLNETVGAGLDTHLSDSDNPHYVTKAQVGLSDVQNFPVATEAEARDGTAPDRYMTPLAVRHAIQSMAGESSGLHFTDYSNPHQVTANQVGAYTKAEIDNFLSGKLGTGEAAADTEMVFGMNEQGLEDWMEQRTAGEALKFGGFTYPEAKDDILSGKAANSERLDGKTYPELRADLIDAVEAGSSTYVIPHMPLIEDDLGDEVEPPEHWVRVGHITFSLPDENDPNADMTSNVTLLITGGRNDETHGDSLHFTSILEVGTVWDSEGLGGENYMMVRGARLKHLTKPVDTDYTIGYKAVGNGYDAILEFYLKFTGSRTPIVLTELSGGQWIPESSYPNWNDISDLITVEPADLEYPTVVSDWTQEIADLQAFNQRTDNPHQVTKAQTGLGNVQNYGLATKAEAEAGTSNAKYMTPQRTKEAIDKIAGDALTAHNNDKTNPHAVTKAQVGLGSVQNYQMATDVEAVTGTATNRYMSPKSSAALVDHRVDEMAQSLIDVMNEALDELNNL